MTLSVLLQQQREHLHTLLALLTRERALLTDGSVDGDALALLSTEKATLLATLSELDAQRRTACRELGCADDPAGDESSARSEDCLDAWQQILHDAREAARINDFNGALIRARMSSNQHLFNELQALAGKNLYGPDGQAHGGQTRLSSRA